MEINELVKKAHENAVNHGFWNPTPAFGTSIALWIRAIDVPNAGVGFQNP